MRRRSCLAVLTALPALFLAGCGSHAGTYVFSVESVNGADKAVVVTANNDKMNNGKAAPLSASPLPWQASLTLRQEDLKDWWALVLIASGGNGPVRCTISKGDVVLATSTGLTATCQVDLH